MNNWTRMNFTPCRPLGKDGRRITGCDEHIALSRSAAAEGSVLLKNDGTLPLKKENTVAVFGKAQYDYVFAGGGSGHVYCEYVRNIYEGLLLKAGEGKFSLYDGIYDYYKEYVEKQYGEGILRGQVLEAPLSEEQVIKAKEKADVAIVTICRFSTEGRDRESVKGDFYLSDEEENMISLVCKHFDKVVALINVGGIIDTEWFKENDKISAALYIWNAGMEGGGAAADIICGDVNPSGKLVDTFTKSFDDYPSSENFNDSFDYKKYYDDIYVGYRYFETIPGAAEKVNYPFGFGLSYTNFELSGIKAEEKDGEILISVTVKNTGNCEGKEVIQVYSSAPEGKLGRPAKELRAFKKTKLLSPGESENIFLSFPISQMATFDDLGVYSKSAYILEGGKYSFYIGTSIRDNTCADFAYEVNEEFVLVEQLTQLVAPKKLEKRLKNDGTYEEMETGEYTDFTYAEAPINTAVMPQELKKLDAVISGEITLDSFIRQFSDDELLDLLCGKPSVGVANTGGMGGGVWHKFGVPCAMTADGPAGVRINPRCETPTTAWPCATQLACTWNEEIVEAIGKAGALEMKENNLFIWLTPALNIHRTPLCGRNFEYFSEDPYVAGKMAAAKVRGMQGEKVAASAKHFACNNYETNRVLADSIVSERALREIYLKGFEICVKEAAPYTIMTSYNKINGHQASEHYELLTGILRGEWGFEGMVTTDWGCAGRHGYEVKAGNDIKMGEGYKESLKELMYGRSGVLKRNDIEVCAKRILEMLIKLI